MDAKTIKPGLKKWGPRIAIALVLLPALIFAAWSAITLNFSYSSGERVGFVQKVSRRGWVCKTYEGELALVSLPGQPATLFPFTVTDPKLFSSIEALAGNKVALSYEQHVGIPSSCFGDTEYFVVGVRKAE